MGHHCQALEGPRRKMNAIRVKELSGSISAPETRALLRESERCTEAEVKAATDRGTFCEADVTEGARKRCRGDAISWIGPPMANDSTQRTRSRQQREIQRRAQSPRIEHGEVYTTPYVRAEMTRAAFIRSTGRDSWRLVSR